MATSSTLYFRWPAALLFLGLVLSPVISIAGMTPEEIKLLEGYKVSPDPENAKAQFILGFCYDNGRGIGQNEAEAVKWYRRSADQGYAPAQSSLGDCYLNGTGLSKNEVEAAKCYRKSADQGFARAQGSLAFCYINGQGVPKDEIEAYAYWNLAQVTDEKSRRNFSRLEEALSPEERLKGQQRTRELQKDIEAKIAAKKAGK